MQTFHQTGAGSDCLLFEGSRLIAKGFWKNGDSEESWSGVVCIRHEPGLMSDDCLPPDIRANGLFLEAVLGGGGGENGGVPGVRGSNEKGREAMLLIVWGESRVYLLECEMHW